MKKLRMFLLIFIALIAVLYLIPVPQKDFSELYKGEENIKTSLLSFREIPTKHLTHNGADWQYISTGYGEKHLLFLHGMGGAYDIWWQQIEALKNDFHIISTTLPEVHSLDEAIDGLVAILDEEGVKKTSIVGSSMGGYMAQYFLKKHPKRLDKLVLGNTFPPNDIYKKENGGIRKALPFIPEWLIMKIFRGSLSEKVTPYSENSPLVEAYLLEQYYGGMGKGQFIGRLDVVLDYFETGYSEAKKSIPKLIIESDNDPLVDPVLQNKLKELYPEAEVFAFHGKGHFPYLNEAVKYNEVLTGFLLK
ncbi:MAG TPA: alpha/beta hydrolase [Bacteroidetes bacterium]|nr:alpha/beta hydrolase [Bacteroidota bacterium]